MRIVLSCRLPNKLLRRDVTFLLGREVDIAAEKVKTPSGAIARSAAR